METATPNDETASALKDLATYIEGHLGGVVSEVATANGELSIRCAPSYLIRVLTFLRDDTQCQFKGLMDLCGVYHPERDPRFDVVYNLLSIS